MAKGNPVAIAVIRATKMIDAPDTGEGYIDGCPAATQDITVNLEKRYKAVLAANYGPMNPALPNDQFWKDKAALFKTDVKQAKTARCSNCAAFIQSEDMMDCIKKGLDSGPEADAVVEAANLGFCEIFDFKCAGDRTCDAWVVNGPVTEVKEDEGGIDE